MRYSLIVLISLLFFAITGCYIDKSLRINDSIVGTWELQKSIGYGIVHYPMGKGNIYTFSNTDFSYYIGGIKRDSGVYNTVRDAVTMDNITYDRLIFNHSDTFYSPAIKIQNNHLTITDMPRAAADGLTSYYIRLR